MGFHVDKYTSLSHGWYGVYMSKKSPTGPTERTPTPEYLLALATYLGPRGPLVSSDSIFDGIPTPFQDSRIIEGGANPPKNLRQIWRILG